MLLVDGLGMDRVSSEMRWSGNVSVCGWLWGWEKGGSGIRPRMDGANRHEWMGEEGAVSVAREFVAVVGGGPDLKTAVVLEPPRSVGRVRNL